MITGKSLFKDRRWKCLARAGNEKKISNANMGEK